MAETPRRNTVAGQVGVHRDAKLNVALALLGGDNESVLRQVLPAKPHCISAAKPGVKQNFEGKPPRCTNVVTLAECGDVPFHPSRHVRLLSGCTGCCSPRCQRKMELGQLTLFIYLNLNAYNHSIGSR
jgi:hypothetical protein